MAALRRRAIEAHHRAITPSAWTGFTGNPHPPEVQIEIGRAYLHDIAQREFRVYRVALAVLNRR